MLDFGYYNMDCMEGMKSFPDKYFDLAVVDPEYGLQEHGGKNRSTYVVQKNGSRSFVSDGHYENRGWDMHPPDRTYFEELIRVSKNQIIFGCNYFDFPLTGGRIIWDKCNDGSDQSGAEIAYNSMSNKVEIFRFMWRGMMQGKSVIQGTIQQGNKKLNEKRIHPTQKPIPLYAWIFSKYTKRGMKLIDTHTGSASSLIAAHDAGLHFVGFEKDNYYYQISKKRLDLHMAQMNIMQFLEEIS